MKRLLILGLIGTFLVIGSYAMAQKREMGTHMGTEMGTHAGVPLHLSIATGGTGGLYYPIGTGMAGLISKHIPNVEAKAEVTSASVDNCRLMRNRKADLALVIGDVAWEAYQGTGKEFKEKVSLRTIAVVYPNFMQLTTLEGKGIEKVTDLKGKRVSTGAPGSWTELTSTRILEAYRLNPDKDLTRSRLGPSDSAAALKDNKIDAFFWAGGLPSASLSELAMSPGIKMKLVPLADAVPLLREKYGPIYVAGIIPAKTYFSQEVDVPVSVVWNLLVCHESMKEDLAYQIIRTLIEHPTELTAAQREARFLNLGSQAGGGSPIPYHPGALRYLSEKGIKIK